MKTNTILGCFQLIVVNVVGSILMSIAIFWLIAALEPDTTTYPEGSASLMVYILSLGFFIYFFMTSFVMEAALNYLKEEGKSLFYKACIALLLLLPFGLMPLASFLFFPALAASIMIFCFSWLINRLRA
jgi:hypothetical protein